MARFIHFLSLSLSAVQKLHLRTFVQKQFNINKIVEKINKLNEEDSDEEDEEMDCSPVVEADEAKKSDQTKADEPMAKEPTADESKEDHSNADDLKADGSKTAESKVDEKNENANEATLSSTELEEHK